MKAIFVRDLEDYLKQMVNGVDIAILSVPLFRFKIFPVVEEAINVLYELNWDQAKLYPTVCFSFFPTTKGEIIDLLRKSFSDIEIIDRNGMPAIS